MTNIKLTPDETYTIFKSRWGIEQPPLVAKQLLGAHRQFVHHPEMCFRLPEFSMIAAVILSYCAACQPACPTGYWDRKPKPTTGRLRRHLSDFDFAGIPLLPRLREKRSVTSHLPIASSVMSRTMRSELTQWRSSATADSLRNIFQSLSEIVCIKKPLCLAGNIRIIFHGHRQRVGCQGDSNVNQRPQKVYARFCR